RPDRARRLRSGPHSRGGVLRHRRRRRAGHRAAAHDPVGRALRRQDGRARHRQRRPRRVLRHARPVLGGAGLVAVTPVRPRQRRAARRRPAEMAGRGPAAVGRAAGDPAAPFRRPLQPRPGARQGRAPRQSRNPPRARRRCPCRRPLRRQRRGDLAGAPPRPYPGQPQPALRSGHRHADPAGEGRRGAARLVRRSRHPARPADRDELRLRRHRLRRRLRAAPGRPSRRRGLRRLMVGMGPARRTADRNRPGAIDAAAMALIEDTITYLEMFARPAVPRLPAPAAKLALIRAEDCPVGFYRYLYETVGTDWLWFERRLWSDAALAAEITRPTTEIFVLYAAGVPAGYFELNAAEARETELNYFGLVPEFIGRGLGAFLLQAAIDRAWSRRFDHPRALPNYQRAGFTVYARRQLSFADPRLSGILPRSLRHPLLPPLDPEQTVRVSIRQNLAEEQPGAVAFRVGDELLRRPALDDLAAVHQQDRVGDGAGEPHLVGDAEHGHAVARQLDHHVEHFLDHLRVERRGRLVEQHDLGLHAQRAGDRHALLLAARQLARILAGLLRDAHPFEVVARGVLGLLARQLAHPDRRQGQVLQHGQVGEQVELLEHHADLAADRLDVFQLRGQLDAGDGDAAALVLFQPVDAADHRRFAGARGAADDDLLPPADGQVDVPQHMEIAVPLVYALHLDHRPHPRISAAERATRSRSAAGSGPAPAMPREIAGMTRR